MFRSFFSPSFWPMLSWNRIRKFFSRMSAACRRNSSLSSSRILSAFICFLQYRCLSPAARFLLSGVVFARHNFRGQRELSGGETKRLLRRRLGNTFHFEQNLAGTDHGHPLFGSAL